MLSKINILRVIFIIGFMLNINVAWADRDLPKSKDHPNIPRIANTTIMGFAESNYDEGVFMTGKSGRKLLSKNIEGKRTRILYIGPKNLSSLGVLRNYQKVFADLGKVEVVYTCRSNQCFGNLGHRFIWRKSNRIPNNLKRYKNNFYKKDRERMYWYGKVTTKKSIFHVSLYSAITSEKISIIANHPVIYLEIIEVAM